MSEELQTALRSLQEEHGVVQSALHAAQGENSKLRTENNVLQARCTRLQKSFDAQHRMHHDTIEKLKDQQAKHEEEIAALQQHLSGVPIA